jgi:hypothetical protein
MINSSLTGMLRYYTKNTSPTTYKDTGYPNSISLVFSS